MALSLLAPYPLPLAPVFAEEFLPPAILYSRDLAKAEHFILHRKYKAALRELGNLPKQAQEDRLVQHRTEKALQGLYREKHRKGRRLDNEGVFGPPKAALRQRMRVVRHQVNADSGSDQNYDERGWAISQQLEAVVEGREELKTRFLIDVEGFQNGHQDLRYRTVTVDFFRNHSHLAFGDSSSFGNQHFMRGSRLRGVNFLYADETHEFQALIGGYPFWLEDRDSYIYPRMVIGARDRFRLLANRLMFGASFLKTRDNEKIRTINIANKPRDNLVLTLEQQFKIIPNVWELQAEESYSFTDDSLLDLRPNDKDKLRDTAFWVKSFITLPWVRVTSEFDRTGPDYRILTSLGSGSVINTKSITADRLRNHHFFDFEPWGPFDLDLQTSWYRNDLDHDSEVEMTRQAWYAADLGILVPKGWPRPRVRLNWINTISSSGPTSRPDETREIDLRTEINHRWKKFNISAFGTYDTEIPQTEENIYNEDLRWTLGTRISRPVWKRLLLSSRYRFLDFEEEFNEERYEGIRHEANFTGSMHMASNANLSLGYTYMHGKINDPSAFIRTNTSSHLGTATFHWPWSRWTWDKKRKFTFHPAITAHITDTHDALTRRPLLVSRLNIGYQVLKEWKVELRGEYRLDDDSEDATVRTEEHRLWLLWSSDWR